jgi:hypothetical protein
MKTRTNRAACQRLVLSATALVACCGTVQAAVINVPADQPTVQAAINAATNGDEIVIAPGTYFEQLDLMGKSLLIRGTLTPELTIIDAGGLLGVAITGSAAVELRGLTFQNGSVTGASGGGIVSTNSGLTITNSILTGSNATEGTGAALLVVGGTIALNNTTVSSNFASSSIVPAPFGGAVDIRDAVATISNSRFEGNIGSGVGGSALGLLGTTAAVITGSTFQSNSATATTGTADAESAGIAVRDSSSLVISGSTFNLNTTAFGDGVAIDVGPLSSAASLSVTNCTFTNNTGTSGANGIVAHSSSGAFSVIDSTFEGNTLTSGTGAGIAMLTNVTLPNGGALIDGCTFRNNTAAVAGAVHFPCLMTISDSLFENNRATGATSGSFVITGGAGAIRSSTAPNGSNITRCTFRGNNLLNPAGQGGGAVRAFRGFLDIVDCVFEDNYTLNLPGGAVMFEGRTSSTLPVFNVRGSTFRNNRAYDTTLQLGNRGGAIGTTLRQNITIDGCTFEGNTAQEAGHIYVEPLALNASILNSTFTGGGAVPNSTGNGGDWGAIYSNTQNSTVVDGVTIDGVTAKISGGIHIAAAAGTVTFQNSTIRNTNAVPNASGQFGDDGAGLVSGPTVLVDNVLIENCTAKVRGGLNVQGSGTGGTATVEDSTFRNNRAIPTATNSFGEVGGLNAGGPTVTVRRSTFDSNRGKHSAGLYIVGGATSTLVEDSTFINNQTNSLNPTSSGEGGGARINRTGVTTVRNNRFIGNSARRGGGLWIDCTTATLVNNLIAGNASLDNRGGGLALEGAGSHTVINSTIANNTGGGIYVVQAQNDALRNCIVWGNTGGLTLDVNTINGGAPTIPASYSIITGGYAGTGNLNVDPQFVNAGTGDFSLAAGSPGIDAGDNTQVPAGTTTDLAGDPRFVDVASVVDTGVGPAPVVDIGAFEAAEAGLVCDSIDVNNDQSFFDPTDIDAFLSVFSEGPCIPETATCNDIDFNNDGSLFDPCDIDAFLLVFSEGPCTLCGV